MPVRVRCPKCDKEVNAPDAARGKAVKCPECQGRIPVPADNAEKSESASQGGAAKSAGKPAAKPVAKAAPLKAPPVKAAPAKKKKGADDDDFLGKLDLSRSEDQNTRVCPKCGQVVEQEDTECANCGIDLQTGGLGKTARKARMKGADPNDFYGLAWQDGTEFVKQNMVVVINSWLNVMILFLAGFLAFVLALVFKQFDHIPSVIFFIVLGSLAWLGTLGWFLSLSGKTIQFALEKKIKLDRTTFETFTAMATGVSWVIWAVAAALPFAPIWGLVWFMTRESGPAINYGVPGLIAAFFILIPVPVAMAHRAMPVNWMVWVSPVLWKITGKTLGGVLYCWLVGCITLLPILLLLGTEILLMKFCLVGTLQVVRADPAGLIAQAEAVGFPLSTGSIGIVAAIFVVLGALILRVGTLFAYTCWAMYMIRVVALCTFYNKKSLELVNEVLQQKYVAKKIELDEFGDPIRKSALAVTIIVTVLGLLVFYGATCAIMASVAPEYLPMPKSWAVALQLIKG